MLFEIANGCLTDVQTGVRGLHFSLRTSFFFLKTTLVAFMLIYIFPAAPTSFGSYFELFCSVANSVA